MNLQLSIPFYSQQQNSNQMKLCCQETVIAADDIYLYKGKTKQNRQKILTHQSQINPLISHSEQRFFMVGRPKEEVDIQLFQQKKRLFIDEQFPPNMLSLGKYEGRKVHWRRLSETLQSIDQSQYNPIDILSLREGDSYFLASLAALSLNPAIIDEVFDQEIKISAVGAYKLNIAIGGKPQQIIIDDNVPVFVDNHQRAAFSHIDPSTFWVVLFEKAFAKVKGSYQNISFGFVHEVLTTFSMSPCLYKLIITDFRHQEQQKCWQILVQCRKMRYPTVVGSRKQYTCNAIMTHKSYCFKTCEIVKHRHCQQKRVFLWNNPGMQQYEQKGIQYEMNGSVINLSLVEFMRNFEIIDIAHVRHNFSSHFYEFKCGPKSPALYNFTTKDNGTLYLTLQRRQGQRGRLRIILIGCRNEGSYQLVAGKRQTLYNDVTVHIQKLPAGVYVVICDSQNESSSLLRIYSQRAVPLFKFIGKMETLLQRTLMQLAHASHSEQFALSKVHQDWYLSKILLDELGVAFFAIHIDERSDLKCQIQLSKRKLAEEGLELINRTIKEEFCVVMERGQSQILVFEFTGKNSQTYSFPPSSMGIRVIV